MRVVLQRVERASVSVDGAVVGSIDHGFCLLVGIEVGDTADDVMVAVDKISAVRIFADDEGKMNRSISEVDGQILVVSQFTLLADLRRGRRPSFTRAAAPDDARALIDQMADAFSARGIATETGVFGAAMSVDLVNDGPVTLVLDVTNATLG